MALSVYNPNWAPLQHLNFPPAEISNMELLAFQQDNFFYPEYPCTTIDDPLFHEPNLHDLNILPYLDNSIPPQAFEYLYPKRQKCYQDDYCCYPEEGLVQSLKPDGFVANSVPLMIPEFSLPEFYGSVMPGFDYGCGEEGGGGKVASGGGGGGSLSAQSVAARQRRRKITEKTQELGKLIPGGHKMNTAEMLNAASKYVKYLQAQVGILEFMASAPQENEEAMQTRLLQALASSPSIQEKLYSSEKCLVPKQFVETLANQPELQSNSLISPELHQLIPSTSSG